MLNTKDFPPLPSQKAPKQTQPKRAKRKAQSARNDGFAASIGALPDELLLQILDYFPGLDLNKSPSLAALAEYPLESSKILSRLPMLANLSLVNRRFYGLVVDKLYAVYNSFFCEPYQFLRTVVANPQIASHVRSIRATHDPSHKMPCRYNPSAVDKRIIKNGLKATGIPGWKAWASNCNEDDAEWDILWVTILFYTPNVSELFLEEGFRRSAILLTWFDIIRRTVNNTSFGRVHQFSYLKTLQLKVEHLDLRDLAPIFRLSSLRTLTIIELTDMGHREGSTLEAIQRLLPVATSPIEDFGLSQAMVDVEVLTVLLKCFRVLKRFELSNCAKPRRADVVIESLKPHHRTLEALCLRESTDEQLTPFMLPGFLGSLQNFEKLSHLEAPQRVLFDVGGGHSTSLVEIFPASITSLFITINQDGDIRKLMEKLSGLASQFRFFPSLQHVRVEVLADLSSRQSIRRHLQKMCTGSNVCLVVELPRFDKERGYGLSDVSPDLDAEAEIGFSSDLKWETESELSDEESLYSNEGQNDCQSLI